MSSSGADGVLQVEGTHNFRDVGGQPLTSGGVTRAGILFRSDGLSRLTPAGVEALAASPIGVVVDLRTALERESAPNILPTTRPCRSVSLPILAGSMLDTLVSLGSDEPSHEDVLSVLETLPSPGEIYVSMLKESAELFAGVARLVASPDDDEHPGVLVHCTAGKDRTGVATALILDAVGVQREAIVADYARTEENLAGPWAEAMIAVIASHGLPITPALRTLVCESPRSAIERALAWVDEEFGGAADYLASGGLSSDDLGALRERLTA